MPMHAHSDSSTSLTNRSCGGARPWTQCEWMISPSYSPVVLSFRRFSLARTEMVTIYDGSRDGSIIATFTGALPARPHPDHTLPALS